MTATNKTSTQVQMESFHTFGIVLSHIKHDKQVSSMNKYFDLMIKRSPEEKTLEERMLQVHMAVEERLVECEASSFRNRGYRALN